MHPVVGTHVGSPAGLLIAALTDVVADAQPLLPEPAKERTKAGQQTAIADESTAPKTDGTPPTAIRLHPAVA